jgi:hypothetical protein
MHASKAISGALNQKTLSLEGNVEMDRPVSVRGKIQRK